MISYFCQLIVFHEKTEHVNHALPIAYLVDKFSTKDEQYKSFGIKYELNFSAIKDCRALLLFLIGCLPAV